MIPQAIPAGAEDNEPSIPLYPLLPRPLYLLYPLHAIQTLLLYGMGRGDSDVTHGFIDLQAYLNLVNTRRRGEMRQTFITGFVKSATME